VFTYILEQISKLIPNVENGMMPKEDIEVLSQLMQYIRLHISTIIISAVNSEVYKWLNTLHDSKDSAKEKESYELRNIIYNYECLVSYSLCEESRGKTLKSWNYNPKVSRSIEEKSTLEYIENKLRVRQAGGRYNRSGRRSRHKKQLRRRKNAATKKR
jgi:hypothetical protein